MRFINKITSSRWDLAFLQENLEEIVANKKIHFIPIKNPFHRKYWFADPFVLDVTDNFIYLLVEAMPLDKHKGIIAKLLIDKVTMTITEVHPLLEEPWHLSFPNIIRQNYRIFVYPESAHCGHLYLYELRCDTDGKDYLKKVETLCDDTIWDTDINNLFGENILFTARQNNYFLDIYQWNEVSKRYLYATSIKSERQNMRLAGALFTLNNKIYIPTQISGYTYGQAVEIQELCKCNTWSIKPLRKVKPPFGLLIDGMHTLNSYKGVTVVDIHKQNNLMS